MEDHKEEENIYDENKKEEIEEEIDDRLIPTTPKISINQNDTISANKGKIIIVISCFLIFIIGLVIALVFIFSPNEEYKEEEEEKKLIIKENIIILKYEIKDTEKKIKIINNNYLNNISNIKIQNSNKSMNISLDPIDSFRFFKEDN